MFSSARNTLQWSLGILKKHFTTMSNKKQGVVKYHINFLRLPLALINSQITSSSYRSRGLLGTTWKMVLVLMWRHPVSGEVVLSARSVMFGILTLMRARTLPQLSRPPMPSTNIRREGPTKNASGRWSMLPFSHWYSVHLVGAAM